MATNVTNLFRSTTNVETFQAGDTIFSTGDTGEVMYVVQQGEVDLLVNGVTIETVGEGSIFGEMALIDNAPRSATAVARTDCRIVPIDRKRFTFLVDETPNFSLTVMKIMSDRLRRSGLRQPNSSTPTEDGA